MGSQSVTDFSAAKKKHIRKLLRSYSPSSADAETQAKRIGALAIGTLAGGATNEFFQALSSGSVDKAVDLIKVLAKQMKENPQQVYKDTGVEGPMARPVGTVSAFLTKALTNLLTASQGETESAFAAKDAIPKTIIDVVSAAFPYEKEPADVDPQKFAQAFRKVTREHMTTRFVENVASSLINLVLDASRGRAIEPREAHDLKQRIRERFVPELINQLIARPRGK